MESAFLTSCTYDLIVHLANAAKGLGMCSGHGGLKLKGVLGRVKTNLS